MRKLIILVVVLAALYSGYWFVGQWQIKSRAADALEQIDAGPMDVSYTDLSLRGFPSRFDTRLTDLNIGDPRAGWSWTAPWIEVYALSYRPNEVIMLFPPEQEIRFEDDLIMLFTQEMMASAKVRANTSLAFVNATFDMVNPRLRTEDGAELAMERLLVSARDTGNDDNSYQFSAQATNIVLPEFIRGLIDREGALPQVLRELTVQGVATFDAPLDRHLLQSGEVSIRGLDIENVAFAWGEIGVTATGSIAAGADGFATGEIALEAANWRQALEVAQAAGLLNENAVRTYSVLVQSLDDSPEDADTLTMTLRMQDGEMAIGDLLLGPAPKLQ